MAVNSLAILPIQVEGDESIVAHFSDGLLQHYSKEETIINGFDEPDGVYLIKKGFVKAYSVAHNGQSNLLLVHEAGEFIPIPWALDGAHTTGLFYEALTNVTVLRASKEKLRSAMGKNAWLAQEILKQTVNVITIYTKRIQTLEFRSARERITSELIYLSERFGKTQGSGIVIDAPITHQEISDSINMTRETASRVPKTLTREKLISQKDHNFVIHDLKKLQAMLG